MTVQLRALGCCLLTCLSAVALAAPAAQDPPAFLQLVAVSPRVEAVPPYNEHWSIFLDGIIDDDAPLRLERFLARREISGAVIYLNSQGGSLAAAMALGRILRSAQLETQVGAREVDTGRLVPAVCFGACPFVLAGGVKRQLVPGSVLGVHRAEDRIPAPDATLQERRARFDSLNYLAEMGVDASLLDVMESVPYDKTRPLTPDEARQFRLID